MVEGYRSNSLIDYFSAGEKAKIFTLADKLQEVEFVDSLKLIPYHMGKKRLWVVTSGVTEPNFQQLDQVLALRDSIVADVELPLYVGSEKCFQKEVVFTLWKRQREMIPHVTEFKHWLETF